jgi:hypothetical protein
MNEDQRLPEPRPIAEHSYTISGRWAFDPECGCYMCMTAPQRRVVRAEERRSRCAEAVERMRERVAAEAIAGAPAGMVAHYAAVEAEHILAGHSSEDAQSCAPCNEAGRDWLKSRRAEPS